ncbi:hypothetical protein ACLOJK_029604 [Asimina triloba]
MANLSSLIHELRERISASSTPSQPGDDPDPLDTRFRSVLPNLLHAYVIPSSTGTYLPSLSLSPSNVRHESTIHHHSSLAANEREVTAVLKLLSHTARNFPGVLFHGKASAILPIIGRILPFFAEPAFLSRHGLIFDTIASLLSLLRSGDREAYRQFFLDAMLVIEDLLSLVSLYADKLTIIASSTISLRCFCESFHGISNDPYIFSDLPACCKPRDGPGVLIDLSDKQRWRPFATWIVKILGKCLTEGTLYVEGLMNASFVSAACTLLCHGDAALHMACFDFMRITTTLMNKEIVPKKNLIQSILCILRQDEKELPLFSLIRLADYNSSRRKYLVKLNLTIGKSGSISPESCDMRTEQGTTCL